MEIKRAIQEEEKMKQCPFKPERKAKEYEKKVGLFQSIDSYERVYKFEV
jgi:hypothetical protein